MKKKILVIITTDFVPFGGLTTVMMNYYRKINKDFFQIDFASTNSDIDKNLISELENNASRYYCLGNRKKRPISYAVRLNRLLRNNSYDIVHINSNSATAFIELYIASKSGIAKRIVHNHTSKCNHIWVHKLLFPFFKNAYTDAIACSKKAGEWIFLNDNYTILNNGIDTEKYRYNSNRRSEIRALYKIEEDCVLIGHLGKIYEPKNHVFLIDIFYQYHILNPNSKLMLVGDGELRSQIEKKVESLNLEKYVIFTGMQTDAYKFLSAMDVFVFPSIWEGMPLSVIEAQASGLSCLVSNRIDETVKVTESLEFHSIDNGIDEWVDALQLRTKIDRNISSQENIEMIKRNNFDIQTNVSKLEDIYRGINQ